MKINFKKIGVVAVSSITRGLVVFGITEGAQLLGNKVEKKLGGTEGAFSNGLIQGTTLVGSQIIADCVGDKVEAKLRAVAQLPTMEEEKAARVAAKAAKKAAKEAKKAAKKAADEACEEAAEEAFSEEVCIQALSESQKANARANTGTASCDADKEYIESDESSDSYEDYDVCDGEME